MDPNGDITDAFDDEQLKRSIAGSPDDPWRNPEAEFVDPKLKELEQQLAHPTPRGYHRRRLDELEERVEHGGQLPKKKDRPRPTAAPPKLPAAAEPELDSFAAPPAEGWTEPGQPAAVAPPTAPAPAPAPAQPESLPRWRQPVADPELIDTARKVRKTRGARRAAIDWNQDAAAPGDGDDVTPARARTRRSRRARKSAQAPGIASYAPSLFAATLVVTGATMLLAVLAGWHLDLVYRAIGAIFVTGVLWRRFQSTRLRAIGIAAVCYAIAFATTGRIEGEEAQSATLLALALVVGGSALLGVQRDEFAPPTA